jgi:50S ribosomal subunit-associated GTPase HflX
MVDEQHKCKMTGCERQGFLSFRGRPGYRYCQVCYEVLAERIGRIGREMRRMQAERRNEAEDNQPARQTADIQ